MSILYFMFISICNVVSIIFYKVVAVPVAVAVALAVTVVR